METMVEGITLNELTDKVTLCEVSGAIMNNGDKKRFFVSTTGYLCYFRKGSSRRGYPFYDTENIKSLIYKSKVKKSQAEKVFAQLQKYKKLAAKASFTNKLIQDCLVERTFEQVTQDSDKDYFGLYYYGITTGTKIDGKCITISGIAKQYPRVAERLREAIKNQTTDDDICHRFPFRGYEMSISTKKLDDGSFMGWLSMEYKDCGNGYYYLLINDETFIGYDVD